MSQLALVHIDALQPVVTTSHNATALGVVPFTITGTLEPGEQNATQLIIQFANPLPVAPIAGWLGNFDGGDFAEAVWSVQGISQSLFVLFARNTTTRVLTPGNPGGAPIGMFLFLAF